MSIIRQELRMNRSALLIWTVSISVLMAVCIFLFPELKEQADEMSQMFSDLGSFSVAFGLDQVGLGTLPGFYSVECGNILGIGGALFCAYTASLSLSREEKEHTSEFLLAHPVSRTRIYFEKFTAVFLQILILNMVCLAVSIASVYLIQESAALKEIGWISLAYFLMQIETAMVCFGFSVFIKNGHAGFGLGIACLFYVLNIMGNMAEPLHFLNWITPFGYCSGADILSSHSLDLAKTGLGLSVGMILLIAGWLKYRKKDIF